MRGWAFRAPAEVPSASRAGEDGDTVVGVRLQVSENADEGGRVGVGDAPVQQMDLVALDVTVGDEGRAPGDLRQDTQNVVLFDCGGKVNNILSPMQSGMQELPAGHCTSSGANSDLGGGGDAQYNPRGF